MKKTAADYFENRSLLIATKHQKEKVIVPLLEKHLGITTVITNDFDTDVLGTFTGEVERADDPLTTIRKKCHQAMDITGYDLCIASEGSFGPHPSLFFVNADDELLLLVDRKNNLEILSRHISVETNFNGAEIVSEEELIAFANQVQFPSHALILRNAKASNEHIIKGITDWTTLKASYHQLITAYGSVYAETDMRAMFNPMRMKVIETATQELIEKIQSLCPQCHTPGFSITDSIKGLPCDWCGSPTKSVLAYVYTCQHCGHQLNKTYPHDKRTEDPMYCDVCNP